MHHTVATLLLALCVAPACPSLAQPAVAEKPAAQSSTGPYPGVGYDQPLRPQFHFSSLKNWINDPNGMLFYDGTYHLFFQHNPQAPQWGNMTWGHATSPDMVHWKQLDHALLPYELDGVPGTIFSGTAVVDHNNSLGKQQGDTKTLVAFFTFATEPKFHQAMAYSTDRGESWQYWNDGRAVVANQGFDSGERDPKVFWHEPSGRWVMALWVGLKPGRVRLFTSTNLTDWEHASDLMRDWAFECMDIVFLPVDGDESNKKCVIYDASFDYEVGTFDGTTFHSETKPLRTGGGNFYAAQTFSNAPNGRVVQMGWMRGGPDASQAYGLPFNQQMSFPCELNLRTTPDGPRLCCFPIEEIDSLVEETHTKQDVELSAGIDLLAGLAPLDLVDLSIVFDPGDAKRLVFDLPSVTLEYDAEADLLKHTGVDDHGAPRPQVTLDGLAPRDGLVRLRLLIDRLSVEAYASGGERFAAHYYAPNKQPAPQSIRAEGGEAQVKELTLRRLRSAW